VEYGSTGQENNPDQLARGCSAARDFKVTPRPRVATGFAAVSINERIHAVGDDGGH
jgi:hypothetical protein